MPRARPARHPPRHGSAPEVADAAFGSPLRTPQAPLAVCGPLLRPARHCPHGRTRPEYLRLVRPVPAVQLRSEQTTLTKQNQDLTQQIQNFDAPQNLASKATELGMVASPTKGQIDLSTLSVTGKAKPAVKGDAPGAVLSPHRLSPDSSTSFHRPQTMNRSPSARDRPAAAGQRLRKKTGLLKSPRGR